MLKNRVITALVLAPLVVLAIRFLPVSGFAVLWGVITLIAAWEWTDLAGIERPSARAAYVGLILALLLAARYTAEYWAPYLLPGWFYGPVVAWWLLFAMALRKVPEKLLKLPYSPALKLGMGGFVLVTAWVLMVWLRFIGPYQVLYLVLLIWLADAAAYFVGKRWGVTRLSPHISPGKTVEGVYGALFAAALLAVGVGLIFKLKATTIADFVFLSLVTVVVSICGDLFESLAKRVRGVKDSSGILPGHGGMLDRVDSLLAAVAVFYAGSLMLDIFLPREIVVLEANLPVQQEIPTQPEEGMGPAEKAVAPDEGGFVLPDSSGTEKSPRNDEAP